MSEKANVDLMKGGSGSKACSLCMISLSLIFCALSGVASVWLPKFINDAIVDSGTICDASDDNFKDFTTPEDPITDSYVFYNWDAVDALAFSRGEGKAIVTEMGPYTWDKKTYTYDVTFADGEMTYSDATTWVYNAAKSGAGVSPDDSIIVESLGYQGLLSKANNEGLVMLAGKKCSAANIKAVGTDLTPFLGYLAANQAATTFPPAGVAKPNSFCLWGALSATNPSGTFSTAKVLPTVDGTDLSFAEDCICCIPSGAGQVGWDNYKGVLDAGLVAQVKTCSYLAEDATINGLFDLFIKSDRALSDDKTDFDAGESYYKNKLTGTSIVDKFPVTAAFHKITVKELAFGYPNAFVGKLKMTGDLKDAKQGVIDTKKATTGVVWTDANKQDIYDNFSLLGETGADLMKLGGYNNAVYSACLFAQKCSTSNSRLSILQQTTDPTDASAAKDIDDFDEASDFDGVLALAFTYLAASACDGELDLAVSALYSGGLITKAKLLENGLDIDGINCKPASIGYAVANHFCGMREDFVEGTGLVVTNPPLKGVLGVSSPKGIPKSDADADSRRAIADCKCLGDTERLKYYDTFNTVYPEVAGCCLAYGFSNALGDLTGFGCMVPIPGRLTGARDSLAAAKAKTISSGTKQSTKNTGCKAGEEENAWNQVNYEEKTEYAVYITGLVDGVDIDLTVKGIPGLVADVVTPLAVSQALIDDLKYLPSPYMMTTLIKQAPVENQVFSKVDGGNGAQIPPQGLDTRSFGGAHLNDNVAVKDSFILWESNTKLGASVSNTGASVVKEIPTQRYELDIDAFHSTGKAGVRTGTNADLGVGFPWKGIVPIGWDRGSSVAISQPNFFNGQNGGSYSTTARTTDVIIDGVDIKDSDGILRTQENIDLDTDNYQTYFDVEISTGKTFQVHQRLQLNTYFGACHDSQTDCGLFDLTLDTSIVTTQLKSVYNVRTPDMLGDVIVPLYRLDRSALIKDDSADAFKGLEKMMQLADIGSIICLLFGVVLGLFGIVKCMQN